MLAKYSPNGVALWTRLATVKGGGSEFIQLARGADGSLYAAGTTTGSCDFGNGVSVSAPAPQSPVLVKYDAEGKALWARIPAGDAEAWRIRAVAVMGELVYWAIQADEAGPNANFDLAMASAWEGGYSWSATIRRGRLSGRGVSRPISTISILL